MYMWGVAMSLIVLLTGAWLMLAPFALGYQPSSASWASATGNSFWVGLAIVVVSLLGVQLFAWSALRQARQAGVLGNRKQSPQGTGDAQVRIADLERTLAQLAAVLAADISAHHGGDTSGGLAALQSVPQPVQDGR
jgi:hypothetical protein